MSESPTTTVTVDTEFFEDALFDAYKRALRSGSAKQFDMALDQLLNYLHEHPESKGEEMPETLEELRVYMLTEIVHGAFGLK